MTGHKALLAFTSLMFLTKKEVDCMSWIVRQFLVVLSSVLLVACGGGGGGGGSGGGLADSARSSGDFTLSANALSFTAASASSVVPSQQVSMTDIGSSVAYVVVLVSQDAASWLSVTVSSSNYATVSVRPTGMAAGTYTTIVRVTTADSSRNTLVSKDVSVTLTVGSAASSSSAASSAASSSAASSAASSSSASSSESSSSVSVPAVIAWSRYNGNSDPTAAGALVLANGSPSQFVQISGSVADSSGTALFMDYMMANGDGTLSLDSSLVPLNRSLIRDNNTANTSPVYPRNMTFLTRVLPVSGVVYGANTRLADFELAFADSRVVLTLRGDAVAGNVRVSSFEDGGPDLLAQIDMSVPHIFQVAVNLTSARAGTLTVYADGVPVIGPVTTTSMNRVYAAGQDYVQFGDNRNAAFRSNLDWMIWSADGAYTPVQISGKLPSGLGVTTGY